MTMGRLRQWSDDEIIEALRAWAARHGRTPRYVDWARERHRPSTATVVYHFGSWNAGLTAAGFTPNFEPGRGNGALIDSALREVQALGITQTEAARHFGVDQSSLSRRLSGGRSKR